MATRADEFVVLYRAESQEAVDAALAFAQANDDITATVEESNRSAGQASGGFNLLSNSLLSGFVSGALFATALNQIGNAAFDVFGQTAAGSEAILALQDAWIDLVSTISQALGVPQWIEDTADAIQDLIPDVTNLIEGIRGGDFGQAFEGAQGLGEAAEGGIRNNRFAQFTAPFTNPFLPDASGDVRRLFEDRIRSEGPGIINPQFTINVQAPFDGDAGELANRIRDTVAEIFRNPARLAGLSP